MDKTAQLLTLGMKAFTLIHALAQQRKDITPAVEAAKKVFSKQPDQITDKELDETEAQLDEMLDDFEKPLNRKA